jgi:hypothetical protein
VRSYKTPLAIDTLLSGGHDGWIMKIGKLLALLRVHSLK